MNGIKTKDIVEEVFSKSINANDRVSALFKCFEQPRQIALEKEGKTPSELKESSAVKDIIYPGGMQTLIVVFAGLVVFVLVFFIDGYLRQPGNDSTKMAPEKHQLNHSEIVSPLAKQPLPNAQPASVPAKIKQNILALDWQHAIDWSSLLGEISAKIPKTVQLNVLESSDGSEMLLHGKALSTDVVYNFVDALSTNRQIRTAELTKTEIEKGQPQDLLTFSIRCSLVSDTKTPSSVESDNNHSGFDRNGLFSLNEADEFFGSIQSASEQTGCMVNSLMVSPKDAVFEDEKTNDRITKKHANLTLLGGYQSILKAVEKLQNHSQGVWFDSVSLKQDSETGELECSMGISVYVADGAS